MARAERAEALVTNLEADIASKEETAVQLRTEGNQAQQTADDLQRQIDQQRGRGRWTRLRLAWRGE
jgi:hypothetical protein